MEDFLWEGASTLELSRLVFRLLLVAVITVFRVVRGISNHYFRTAHAQGAVVIIVSIIVTIIIIVVAITIAIIFARSVTITITASSSPRVQEQASWRSSVSFRLQRRHSAEPTGRYPPY